jgi:hypothetical protein
MTGFKSSMQKPTITQNILVRARVCLFLACFFPKKRSMRMRRGPCCAALETLVIVITYIYIYIYIFADYFPAVAVSPPAVSTLRICNSLLQCGPLLPLPPSHRLSSPVSTVLFPLLLWYHFSTSLDHLVSSTLLLCSNYTNCSFCTSSILSFPSPSFLLQLKMQCNSAILTYEPLHNEN